MHKRILAAVLAAVLLAACTAAAMAETTPLGAQSAQTTTARRLAPFTSKRSYLGVAASRAWLHQAKLGNRLLNLRMFTAQGDQLTFQEKLTAASTGGADICLQLVANHIGNNVLLQLDQDAVDTLLKLNITEIVVADADSYVQAEYLTEDLAALRRVFGVDAREQLCVSGENEPVTVVSVDGVRRQITK